jgi:hypothetical protein
MQTHLYFLDRYEYEKNVNALRTQLDRAAFDAAWTAGRALTLEQAIELALSEGRL